MYPGSCGNNLKTQGFKSTHARFQRMFRSAQNEALHLSFLSARRVIKRSFMEPSYTCYQCHGRRECKSPSDLALYRGKDGGRAAATKEKKSPHGLRIFWWYQLQRMGIREELALLHAVSDIYRTKTKRGMDKVGFCQEEAYGKVKRLKHTA